MCGFFKIVKLKFKVTVHNGLWCISDMAGTSLESSDDTPFLSVCRHLVDNISWNDLKGELQPKLKFSMCCEIAKSSTFVLKYAS